MRFLGGAIDLGRLRYPAGGTGGLYKWMDALPSTGSGRQKAGGGRLFFGWAWLVTPPFFGVALSSIPERIIPVYSIFVKC